MKIFILGNGGFAQEIFEQVFLKKNNYNFGGFIILKDDKAFVINEEGVCPFDNNKQASFILGTQNNYWRNKFLDSFLSIYEASKTHFPNIYSDKAHVSYTSIKGIGNIFAPYSSVSGVAYIGDFNLFNSYSSVQNRSKIGNNNILQPYAGIMNQCSVGDNNILQPNSIVTEKITIGNKNIISAGECVFDNINDNELFQSGIIQRIDKGI